MFLSSIQHILSKEPVLLVRFLKLINEVSFKHNFWLQYLKQTEVTAYIEIIPFSPRRVSRILQDGYPSRSLTFFYHEVKEVGTCRGHAEGQEVQLTFFAILLLFLLKSIN